MRLGEQDASDGACVAGAADVLVGAAVGGTNLIPDAAAVVLPLRARFFFRSSAAVRDGSPLFLEGAGDSSPRTRTGVPSARYRARAASVAASIRAKNSPSGCKVHKEQRVLQESSAKGEVEKQGKESDLRPRGAASS